jgi:hypothetical protein
MLTLRGLREKDRANRPRVKRGNADAAVVNSLTRPAVPRIAKQLLANPSTEGLIIQLIVPSMESILGWIGLRSASTRVARTAPLDQMLDLGVPSALLKAMRRRSRADAMTLSASMHFFWVFASGELFRLVWGMVATPQSKTTKTESPGVRRGSAGLAELADRRLSAIAPRSFGYRRTVRSAAPYQRTRDGTRERSANA